MILSNSESISNKSGFELSFKSNQLSHQDSTEYSSNSQIQNSLKYKSMPPFLSSPSTLGSNISIDIRSPVEKQHFSLTDRIENKQKAGSFQKQYHFLLEKFKLRGSKFYKTISELRRVIQGKDLEISDLQQNLTRMQNQLKTNGNRSLNLGYSHCGNSDTQALNNRHSSTAFIADNNLQIKKRSHLLTHNCEKLSSSVNLTSTRIRHEPIAAVDTKWKYAESLEKSIQSHEISQEFYEQQETFRSQEVDLIEQTIAFFQGKLEILQSKIHLLTQNNLDLEQRLNQKESFRVIKEEKTVYLENLVEEQHIAIQNLCLEIKHLQSSIQKTKEESRTRISQLSGAFVKLNKQNRDLAFKNYQSQGLLKQRNIKMSQVMEANSILLKQIQAEKELKHKKIDELTEQIRSFEQENFQLRREIAAAENTLQQKIAVSFGPTVPAICISPVIRQLQEEIDNLNYKMEIINDRFIETCNTNKILDQKVKSHEKQILTLTSEIIRLQSANVELKQIQVTHTQRSKSLIQSCSSIVSEDTQSQIKPIVKYYQDEASKLNKCIRDMKVQLSDRDNTICFLKSKVDSLTVQLLNDKKSHQQYHDNHMTQSNTLKSRIESLNLSTHRLEEKNKVLEVLHSRHQSTDQYQLQVKADQLQMQIAILNMRIKDVDVENRKLKDSTECAMIRKRQATQKYIRQKEYSNQLQNRIKQMEEMRVESDGRESLRIELEENTLLCEQQLIKKSMEIHLLNNKIQSYVEKHRNIELVVKGLEQEKRQLTVDNERLEVTNKELWQRVDKLQCEEKEQGLERDEFNSKIQLLEQSIEEIRDNYNKLEDIQGDKTRNQSTKVIERLQLEVQHLKQSIENMTDTQIFISTVSRKDKLIWRLQEDIKLLRQKRQESMNQQREETVEMQQWKVKMEEISKDVEEKDEEIEELEMKNKRLGALLEKLNVELINQQLKYGDLETSTAQLISKYQSKSGIEVRSE